MLDKDGKSNFQLLQNAIDTRESTDFYYYIFDLLYYDAYCLMHLPLIERKHYLQQLLQSLAHPYLLYSDHIIGHGYETFKKSCEMGLEGIISKNTQAAYHQKRTRDWVKVKCTKRQEFIIGGFTKPKGSRKHFGALLLGTSSDKGLIYHGNVGTGFTETSLKEISQQLTKYISDKNPFVTKPPGLTNITFLKPALLAEVEFTEWTKDDRIRHPSFKGLRKDKNVKSIVKETVKRVKGVAMTTTKITNPGKILYKEDQISKQDLVDYYQLVGSHILPYLKDRPLTIVRCPSGYQKCFFQKHLSHKSSHIKTLPIKDKSKNEEYFYIRDTEGLIELVQMGTLEFHPWGSTKRKIEHPDQLIFDLDPAPKVPWTEVVAAAHELKKVLKGYDLKTFVKTTGGKGLHVVVPINPEYDWEQVKLFAHTLVDFLVLQYPKKYIVTMSKMKRKGKIFIDYLRNSRGATAVAPYSTRARIHAPVSVPLAWKELNEDFEKTFYTIKTLPKRLAALKKDPWQDFFDCDQSLRLDKLQK